jgi:hypothetical protein
MLRLISFEFVHSWQNFSVQFFLIPLRKIPKLAQVYALIPTNKLKIDPCLLRNDRIPYLSYMKKLFITTLLFCTTFTMLAQVNIYQGNSTYRIDLVCNVQDGKVYKGDSNFRLDVIFTIKDSKIYKGNFTFIKDIVATVKNGRVYKGNSFFQGDILFNIKDGYIYKGDSISSFDIIATIEDGKVYQGRTTFRSDILFTIDGELTLEEFVAIWLLF